jgi:hypothetical protein
MSNDAWVRDRTGYVREKCDKPGCLVLHWRKDEPAMTEQELEQLLESRGELLLDELELISGEVYSLCYRAGRLHKQIEKLRIAMGADDYPVVDIGANNE